MNRYRLTVLVPLLFLQIACATYDRRQETPDALSETARLATRCEEINRTLASTRGIGRILLTHRGRPQRLRFAWTSVIPAKLRAVVLGLDGRPLVTVSSDGSGFYYHDHTTGKFRRYASRKDRLTTVLRLPLEVDGLTRLLAGRLPSIQYDRVQPADGRTPEEAGIVLKRGWNRVGRIYVQPAGPSLARVEAYRQTGELRYRADIKKYMKIEGFLVPKALSIQDAQGRRVELDIERYWANVPVPPETFRLEPPN